MSNKKYLIKLTPLEKFFFGGERTFGTGDETNYLVKSNYFPQQTGLLGMLRYELLLQNGLLKPGKGSKLDSQAAQLIGATGFRIGGNNDFGVINKISSLFTKQGTDRIVFNPLNAYIENDSEKINMDLEGFDFIFNGEIPDINDYCLKDHLQKGLTDKKSCKKNHFFTGLVSESEKIQKVAYRIKADKDNNLDGVFIEDTQIGIHKKGDKDAFYKQTFYRMKEGFSFAFFVEMNWDKYNEEAVLESNTIFMGGEKSAFQMEVIPVDNWEVPEIPNLGKITDNIEKNIHKIILNSHCYASPNIYDECAFAITQTVDFRFLETAVAETENYNALNIKNKKDRTKPVRSEKFNLLKAGSILYVEEAKLSNVKTKLDNSTFEQIGYNHYSIYPKPLT